MAVTAHQARTTARPVTGAVHLDWLRPAVETAAPPASHRPVAGGCWAERARVATRTPGLEPGSVKAARNFADATLRRWGLTELCDDVAIVLSELLTNALRHGLPRQDGYLGPAPVRVGLLNPGPCVLCAVADPSAQVPVMTEPDYLAETGRGLHVIASLSDRWGWTAPGSAGKIVWATFHL